MISNCVINLAPDKPAVFREIARVLKPGGRLAVSDIALKRELPPELGDDLMAYVGCIAGAISDRGLPPRAGRGGVRPRRGRRQRGRPERLRQGREPGGVLPAAGPASGLAVVDTGCCTPGPAAVVDQALHNRLADLLKRYDVNDFAASVKVFAVKPR